MKATRYIKELCTVAFWGVILQAAAQKTTGVYHAIDSTRTEEILYEIKTVHRISPDSAVVTISYGKKDGIFWGAEGNIMTSHNSGAPAGRQNVAYVGSAHILTLTDTSATAGVKMYKNYRETAVLPKDLLGLQTYLVKNTEPNVFYELAKLDILFLDNARKEIKSKKEILQESNSASHALLLEKYKDEISDFYTDLLEYKDSTFTRPYMKGPYKGLNMHQVFEKVTVYDLESFFHFVRKYPGKYIGGRWKINETFATWVLNDAPQGDNNREWIIPNIMSLSDSVLPVFARRYRFMIESDSLAEWSSKVWEFQNNDQKDKAEQLCNKLITVARFLNDKKAENEFIYTRSFLLDAQGNTYAALEDALAVYNADKTNINYGYNLASLYGKLEMFDKCFALYESLLAKRPDNYNIKGNLGWYKLTAGQVDEAIPYCKAAYLADPGSVAFTINYGHTFLLKGNMDSARYYYQKTLDNLGTTADYLTGPKTDFDLFFKKGWQRKAVAEMADWMENQFNEKYYIITKGNEIRNKAKKAANDKNYQQSVSFWQNYIGLTAKAKEPDYVSLRQANRWAGYCYYKMKRYDSSFYYYEKAMNLSQQHLVQLRNKETTKDNDDLIADLNDLKNVSELAGWKKISDRYRMMHDAESEKITELFTEPALHLLVAGSQGDEHNKTAANFFYTHCSKLQPDGKKDGVMKMLTGKELTRDKLVAQLEEVRKKSKPEDIFIFYYAGEMASDGNGDYFSFDEKDSTQGRLYLEDFMNNFEFVYAHKKMIVTDQPSVPLLTLITSRFTNAGRNATDILYLSPGIETPQQDNNVSLFTNQLVGTLTELQNEEKFTARDFADKASYKLGRGQYYFPVFSFSFGKDFLLYENKKSMDNNATELALKRGTEITNKEQKNAEVTTGLQKNYALIFAGDLYADKGFDKLANPIYDGNTLGGLLTENFGFEVTLVKNPTLDKLENTLSDFRDRKNYGPNDQLFIFFAGHGVYDEKSKMGYLVANDSKLNDPNFKTFLSYSDLGNKYLKNIKCNRIFLVLDACFAGTFFDDNTVRGADQEANTKNLESLKSKASNLRFKKGISSGAKQYVEDGKPGQHSPFASKFLTTLWNKAMNKSFVTADELIGEIKSNPPGSTAVCEGKFHYSDPFSHFIFELQNQQKISSFKSANLK